MPERKILEYALAWANNSLWKNVEHGPLIWFVVPDLASLNPLLRDAVYAVETTLPDYDTRLEYITALDLPKEVWAKGMNVKILAAQTAGLLLRDIGDMPEYARKIGGKITRQLVTEFKRKIIETAYAGLLEPIDPSGITLDDVAGAGPIVSWLRSIILPDLEAGNDQTPVGMVLSGPPGTGKTHLARCLAGEAGFNMVALNIGSLLGKYVGDSEGNLRRAISAIKSLTPVIVFIDEIDQGGVKRDSGNSGNNVGGNMFQSLLTFISEPENRGKIFWVAATNRPDLIDAALIRSGRLETIAPIMPPATNEDRVAMLNLMIGKYNLTIQGVDLLGLAAMMPGYTGADIERVVLKAAQKARIAKSAITHEHLAYAVAAIQVNRAERQQQINLALQFCSDLDMLPDLYQQQQEQTDNFTPSTGARSF